MRYVIRAPNKVFADTPEKCQAILRRIEDAEVVGVDTEVVGVDIGEEHPKGLAKAISIQFATDDFSAFVPLWDEHIRNLRIFKKWLEYRLPVKVLHNAKFDMHVLMNHGIRMRGLLADTMVMDFMYDSSQMSHALKECMRRYFNELEAVDYNEAFREPTYKKDGSLAKRTRVMGLEEVLETGQIDRLVTYAIKDPEFTVRLYRYLRAKMERIAWIKDKNYYQCYHEFDRPFTDVLFDVEQVGALVDQDRLQKMAGDLGNAIADSEGEFLKGCVLLGASQSFMEKFNPGSNDQLGRLLTDYLGVPLNELTATGKPKVSQDVLSSIRARGETKRVIDKLLEFRRMQKFLGTYAEPMLRLAPLYQGRIHTNYRQIGTATLRLSSSNPNLQNVPTKRKDSFGIRECFIAPDGMTIGDIDLDQIEMRLAAHFTADPVMLEAIRKGWDLHGFTAARVNPKVRAWLKDEKLEISSDVLKRVKGEFGDERQDCKTLNFGVIYGMGPQRYASMVGCSLSEGKKALEAYFEAYSGLRRGIRNIQRKCYDTGYVQTVLKRYLRIPDIRSSDSAVRSYGERCAFNYVVQGCKSAESFVLTEKGYIRIDELYQSSRKPALVQPFGSTNDYVVLHTGRKKVYRVYTSGGCDEVTADHRFFVGDGRTFSFKKLSELRVGDWVIETHPGHDKADSTRVTEDAAELLGVILGNGWYAGNRGVHVAIGKMFPEYAKIVSLLFDEFFGRSYVDKVHKVTSTGKKTYVWRVAVWSKKDVMKLRELGLVSAIRDRKRVPSWVFTQPARIRAAVLRGLFDTDGSVARGCLVFTSCGIGLVKDVQVLLSSLCIPSSVVQHGERAYRVRVRRDDFDRFSSYVGFSNSVRAKKLVDLLEEYSTKRVSRTRIPHAVVHTVSSVIRTDASWKSIRESISSSEYVLRHRFAYGNGTKEACRQALSDCAGGEAMSLLSVLDRYNWACIYRIQLLGKQDTYDIAIHGEDHSYISNGFVQHNSAADLLKMSMILIQNDDRLEKWGVRMVMQVHDELLFEVPKGVEKEAKKIIDEFVSHPYRVWGLKDLLVDTPASMEFGPNWAEAKK